jgi:chemotaxis protein MotB
VSRKAKPESHVSHERWLVSYADFITLMFAFFVVMFASSQTDKARAKQVSQSVTEALEEGRVMESVVKVLGGRINNGGRTINRPPAPKAPSGPKVAVDLQPSMEYLSLELKKEIAAGKLRIHLEPRGLIVSLTQAAFFSSGEDTIDADTYGSIATIAGAIRKLPNPVRLEGHTDSVPIHNSRFRSNWELSSARAIAMLELLKTRCEVPETQLAVAGYADTCPVDSNETEAGRARNRRVDIVILTKSGFGTEPSPAPAPARKAPE